jgi:hypothetical protein
MHMDALQCQCISLWKPQNFAFFLGLATQLTQIMCSALPTQCIQLASCQWAPHASKCINFAWESILIKSADVSNTLHTYYVQCKIVVLKT